MSNHPHFSSLLCIRSNLLSSSTSNILGRDVSLCFVVRSLVYSWKGISQESKIDFQLCRIVICAFSAVDKARLRFSAAAVKYYDTFTGLKHQYGHALFSVLFVSLSIPEIDSCTAANVFDPSLHGRPTVPWLTFHPFFVCQAVLELHKTEQMMFEQQRSSSHLQVSFLSSSWLEFD